QGCAAAASRPVRRIAEKAKRGAHRNASRWVLRPSPSGEKRQRALAFAQADEEIWGRGLSDPSFCQNRPAVDRADTGSAPTDIASRRNRAGIGSQARPLQRPIGFRASGFGEEAVLADDDGGAEDEEDGADVPKRVTAVDTEADRAADAEHHDAGGDELDGFVPGDQPGAEDEAEEDQERTDLHDGVGALVERDEDEDHQDKRDR